MRDRLRSGRTIWAAGAYDALSAKIIESAGFQAVFTTGFGISASFLAKPDIGLYTMSENLAIVRQIVNSVELPVVADCDNGYGNEVNAARTVSEFESAGVAGLVIEDQVFPKCCPAIGTNPLEIVPIEQAVAKIRAAVEMRRDPDLVIVARTDAATEEEAIERARAYVAAGADMVQPNSRTKSAAVLRHLKAAAGVPVSLQILGWMEKQLSPPDIESIAGLAVFPLVAVQTVALALQRNLSALARTKSALGLPLPHADAKEVGALLGFGEH
jgi:methylisocitrate lyase